MDQELRKQRRKQATLARRNVYKETPDVSSYYSSLSPDERIKFVSRARSVNAREMARRTLKRRIFTVIGVIVISAAALLAIFPIFFTFLNSFMSSSEIDANYGVIFQSLPGGSQGAARFLSMRPQLQLIPQQVSAEQYSRLLFMTPSYLFRYWNSILLTVPIVAGQLIVACLASYSFTRYRRKRREILFFAYVILMLMPFQVTLVPNYLISDKLNLLDSYASIILPGIFSTFSIYLLTKYMRQIPSAYIEAAKIDGAGEWQIFAHIVMPNCRNAVVAMAILLFIDYWNMVEQPLIMLSSDEKRPLSVFLAQVNMDEIGMAFAACALYMLPPLLVFLRGEDYLVEGVSKAGIK
ncbi:multiple sugar transport system permease protein [Ruminococcaceae bacterium YRB3002]|nr:multiple sugar transport system permease protein [Ruminococcaceae bacterium YRB3002]